jgi:hypothetical protein
MVNSKFAVAEQKNRGRSCTPTSNLVQLTNIAIATNHTAQAT